MRDILHSAITILQQLTRRHRGQNNCKYLLLFISTYSSALQTNGSCCLEFASHDQCATKISVCAYPQDLPGAAEAYTVVLDLSDAASADRLAAASNRAACYLAQAQYSSTVTDCNLAFGLLTGQDSKACHLPTWLSSDGMPRLMTTNRVIVLLCQGRSEHLTASN